MRVFLVLLLVLGGCAHKEMNQKRAEKLCRKIYGPPQKLPAQVPEPLLRYHAAVSTIVTDCYRQYTETSSDPRDYVSCTMTTLRPDGKPRLTILSTQEMLLPEIVIQCAQREFERMKKIPRVNKPIQFEKVFHHLTVTKG